MRAAVKHALVALALAALPFSRPAIGAPKDQKGFVLAVLHADMLLTVVDGQEYFLSLIGVDPTGTSDPARPVKFLGSEPREFIRSLVERRPVLLRKEPRYKPRDSVPYIHRYVFLEDGRLLNAEVIRQGYGFAHLENPFSLAEEFKAHEEQARAARAGLWARVGERAVLDSAGSPGDEPGARPAGAGTEAAQKAGGLENVVIGDQPLGAWQGKFSWPELICSTRVQPQYPPRALRERRQARVILQPVIGKDGGVREIRILRPLPTEWGFDEAAVEAVKKWRYEPALLGGRPIDCAFIAVVDFKLR